MRITYHRADPKGEALPNSDLMQVYVHATDLADVVSDIEPKIREVITLLTETRRKFKSHEVARAREMLEELLK